VRLLVLTDGPTGGTALTATLEMLGHETAVGPRSTDTLEQAIRTSFPETVVVDATNGIAAAAGVCRALAASEQPLPVLLVVEEAGLAALKGTWGFDDWVLACAQPAELETRLRLVREGGGPDARASASNVGDLSIDENTYIVRVRGRPVDLTYREFELLKFLADNPGRVFTRGQLLKEVWGYDYFGGTRTVDVHIRRLRAKVGAEHEQLIGTVRGVGYKLDPQGARAQDEHDGQGDGSPEGDAQPSPGGTSSA
jgi:DNA-binding response OmpR family regulator